MAQGSAAQAAVIPSNLLNPSLPGLDDPSRFLPLGNPQIRLVLRLAQRRVFVYRNDQQVASYPVAVGKPGWETPTGEFQIIQMVENPVWENPWTGEVRQAGPDSALGLRWIGFWTDGKDTIGFHGTPTVNSIGRAASHGCVRMRNEDVVALFNQVEMGTVVIVEP
ncbi:MAG: L,D-transpeptidase [Cyanobacteria bacterium J06592_8]